MRTQSSGVPHLGGRGGQKPRIFGRLVILALIATILVLTWIFWPRQTLGLQASNLVDAFVKGDTSVLWERSIERLRGDSGLTDESFQRLYNELIAPRMKGWHIAGDITVHELSGETTAVADVLMRHESGAESRLGWTVFNDGNDFALVRLADKLIGVWNMEYLASGGNTSDRNWTVVAKCRGLQNDLPALRRLGLKGLVPLDPSEPVKPLHVWLREYQDRLSNSTFPNSR